MIKQKQLHWKPVVDLDTCDSALVTFFGLKGLKEIFNIPTKDVFIQRLIHATTNHQYRNYTMEDLKKVKNISNLHNRGQTSSSCFKDEVRQIHPSDRASIDWMLTGPLLSPIILIQNDALSVLLDGNHRCQAASLIGDTVTGLYIT